MAESVLVGYARVSSIDQDLSSQKERLKNAGCTKIFSEKKSGVSKKNRNAFNECQGYLREGDILVITKIDRLARSARDLHNLIHKLNKEGIALKILDLALDTNSATGKAFLGMLATFAEFETNLIKDRQFEGIKRAKKKGIYKGRKPTAIKKKAEVLKLLESGISKAQIARELGISIGSVYNILKLKSSDDSQLDILKK